MSSGSIQPGPSAISVEVDARARQRNLQDFKVLTELKSHIERKVSKILLNFDFRLVCMFREAKKKIVKLPRFTNAAISYTYRDVLTGNLHRKQKFVF